MGFFGKNNGLFAKVSPKFAKLHSLILPIFFLRKVLCLNVFKKILGRRMQRRIQNPVKHLRRSILQILVNDF